jgi:hypothetical protein
VSTERTRWLIVGLAPWLLAGCVERGDAMPPMLTIREPSSGITAVTENLQVVGYAMDDAGIVAIRVNGSDLLDHSTLASERGKRLVEFRFLAPDWIAGVDYTFTIEAEDASGRVTTLPYRLRLDNQPPSIELTSVSSLGGGRLRVTGVARDDSLLSSIEIAGVPLAFSPAAEHEFRVDVAAAAGAEIVVTDAAGYVTRRALR